MKKKDKEILIKYTNILISASNSFLLKNLCDPAQTDKLIDITLSAHLSSCFTMMVHIAEISDNKNILIEVNKFIRKMEDILPTLNPITKIETSRYIRDN
jgi:hypothetical protein